MNKPAASEGSPSGTEKTVCQMTQGSGWPATLGWLCLSRASPLSRSPLANGLEPRRVTCLRRDEGDSLWCDADRPRVIRSPFAVMKERPETSSGTRAAGDCSGGRGFRPLDCRVQSKASSKIGQTASQEFFWVGCPSHQRQRLSTASTLEPSVPIRIEKQALLRALRNNLPLF